MFRIKKDRLEKAGLIPSEAYVAAWKTFNPAGPQRGSVNIGRKYG